MFGGIFGLDLSMTLVYNGKELTQTTEPCGGKNKGSFYHDSNGNGYFIKAPKKIELFTELFAGLLLKEFTQRGLIAPNYVPSLIYAEAFQFEDGTYGLIQPRVSFTELYKTIGTGYRDGSDRNPFTEMFFGPSYYSTLVSDTPYFGLSLVLMFSLLLGDNSVHSGNVVQLSLRPKNTQEPIRQFARIDWGAAFRHFGHPENHRDILKPYEYHGGALNLKWFTKGYISNYKFRGLYSAIAEKATILKTKLDTNLLKEIVASAFKKIPGNLFDDATKAQLADYLYFPSFKDANFDEGVCEPLIIDFTNILYLRLEKICVLHGNSLASSTSPLYQSTIFELATIDEEQSTVIHEEIREELVGDEIIPEEDASAIPQTLPNELLTDETLKRVISNAPAHKPLSKMLIDDLLTLKKFHDTKINNKFGKAYNDSVHRFYEQAIITRLSHQSLVEQANAIIGFAQKEFQPRHNTRRLLADFFMAIGFLFGGLGLVVGLSRRAMGKTFFFSQTITDREEEFTKQWLIKNEELAKAEGGGALLIHYVNNP